MQLSRVKLARVMFRLGLLVKTSLIIHRAIEPKIKWTRWPATIFVL